MTARVVESRRGSAQSRDRKGDGWIRRGRLGAGMTIVGEDGLILRQADSDRDRAAGARLPYSRLEGPRMATGLQIAGRQKAVEAHEMAGVHVHSLGERDLRPCGGRGEL